VRVRLHRVRGFEFVFECHVEEFLALRHTTLARLLVKTEASRGKARRATHPFKNLIERLIRYTMVSDLHEPQRRQRGV
jgi:hypothetical protein